MPSAIPELQEKFPGMEQQALAVLRRNFIEIRNGVIIRKDPEYQPTQREYDAIDYLFYEWDFMYEPPE